jgi:hypothetical protein
MSYRIKGLGSHAVYSDSDMWAGLARDYGLAILGGETVTVSTYSRLSSDSVKTTAKIW